MATIHDTIRKLNHYFISDEPVTVSDAIWFYGINGGLSVMSVVYLILIIAG